jgi:hypothetical protein
MIIFLLFLSNLSADESNKKFTVDTIDVCRCLQEKGSSDFMKANNDVCNQAISKKLEVPDWQKVNFTTNKDAEKKWKELETQCNDTTSKCMETEKQKMSCYAKDISDPKWQVQNCTNALITAMKNCQ